MAAKGIHQFKDDHYKVSLPLKNLNMELSSSEELTLGGFMKIKWRLASESQFCKDYNQIMQDIISGSYAQKVPIN